MLAERLLTAEIGVPQAGRYASLATQVLESRGTAEARAAQVAALDPTGCEDPLPRGLPSRSSAGGQGRCLIIIDFEGEPSRSLAERRAKHLPLRDVVGMLRSFNYAAHAALRQATADGTCDRATLWPYLSDWEQQTRAAFLNAYVEVVGDSPGYPTDPDQAKILLELFL